jgi:hypothetical protein
MNTLPIERVKKALEARMQAFLDRAAAESDRDIARMYENAAWGIESAIHEIFRLEFDQLIKEIEKQTKESA